MNKKKEKVKVKEKEQYYRNALTNIQLPSFLKKKTEIESDSNYTNKDIQNIYNKTISGRDDGISEIDKFFVILLLVRTIIPMRAISTHILKS